MGGVGDLLEGYRMANLDLRLDRVGLKIGVPRKGTGVWFAFTGKAGDVLHPWMGWIDCGGDLEGRFLSAGIMIGRTRGLGAEIDWAYGMVQ